MHREIKWRTTVGAREPNGKNNPTYFVPHRIEVDLTGPGSPHTNHSDAGQSVVISHYIEGGRQTVSIPKSQVSELIEVLKDLAS